jgi:hypothetical protein
MPGLCLEDGRPLNQPQLQAMPLFTLDMLTGDPMMRGLGKKQSLSRRSLWAGYKMTPSFCVAA